MLLTETNWKKLYWTLAIIVLITMPLLSRDYGQTGDEWLQLQYGHHIWNYFTKGDPQALDYSQMSLQYQGQEYYGGLFDFSMEVLHQWFPSIPLLTLRHFFNALTGALIMIFTGLLAWRLTRKWSIGVLALLFIVFSPRIFGESMNNPKDIPFASGFIIAIYYLVALLQEFPKRNWKNVIGIAIGFGIAFGVRSAGGMLLAAEMVLYTGLFYALNSEFKQKLKADNNKLLKRFLLLLIGAFAGGYIIGLAAWPWGLQSPIANPLESLKQMTNRATVLRVLFEGVYRPNNSMPWYYEFKWITITSPLVVIAGLLLSLGLIMQLKKRYGVFVIALLLLSAFFPLVYMIYKKSSVYDTWRHVFFVYPFIVVLAAIGWDTLTGYFKNEKTKWVPYAVAFLGLLPAIVWTVRSHPNQYVYFNELTGGIKGAYGYYDIDYYQNSGKQAADWIRENVKPIPGRKIFVRSNLSDFGRYFERDTSWIASDYGRYNERYRMEWDYYVTYPRYVSAVQMQNDKWNPANIVYKAEIDGAPLCIVIQRKSYAGKEAYDALQQKDFAAAISKFEEYLKTDASDENVYINYGIALASAGQLDAAVAAITKATELDPSRPEYFQTLAEIYRAKGDMQGYQSATASMNALIMEEQENVGE
jgi:tetratricopeptide (TPR) repeat protein